MSKDALEQALQEHGEAIKQIKTGLETKVAESSDRIDKLEGRLNRAPLAGDDLTPGRSGNGGSIGRKFARSDRLKAFMANEQGRGASFADRIECKSLLTSTIWATGSPTPNTFPVFPQRDPNIYGYAFRRLGFLDLLPVVPVVSNRYEYVQSSFTNNAAVQAGEGEAKAQSAAAFAQVEADIFTFAHSLKASRQVLDDAPQLESYIDQLLMHGIKTKLEHDLIQGDGDNQINGFLNQVSEYGGGSPTPSLVDRMGGAAASIEAIGYTVSAAVMHPSVWNTIRTSKDSQDRYIAGDFNSPAQPNAWGVPVVTSAGMPTDTILMGDFANHAALLMRQDVKVELGFVNDDFTKNIWTLLGEARAGLQIKTLDAFLTVSVP